MASESEALSYKEQQERFVSDNSGTSVLEILKVSAVCPVSIFMRDAMLSWLFRGKSTSKRIKFLFDFVCVVMPGLMGTTMLSSHLDELLLTMLSVGFLLAFTAQKSNEYISKGDSSVKPNKHLAIMDFPMSVQRPFITNFRAFVNIATAIMILAVDFKVFPRSFCKTETFGTGLMDIGVGGFIVANGIVSPEARGKFNAKHGIFNRLKQILHAFTSTLPLWVIGGIRILAVKSTDYHEHVSEYGVHWNFFFTLAIVKVLSTIVLQFFPVSFSWLLSIIIVIFYQYLLVAEDLREFIMFGSDGAGGRDGFVNANREGICSSLGYLALYLASVSVGTFLAKSRGDFKDWLKAFVILFMLDSMLWNLLGYITLDGEPVSRRMANLGYVLWMLAHQLFVLCSLLFVDLFSVSLQHMGLFFTSKSEFCLLEAVNRNGLAFFMLGNLLTGLVNFSMETIYASPLMAYIILVGYMVIMTSLAAILHVKKITIRYW